MKTIALCSNLTAFNEKSAWYNPAISDKYPGSGFVSYLDTYARKEGIEALPGPIAWAQVCQKELDPNEVYVVQEETNFFGMDLIERGCHAKVVLCLESPLYTPFYQILPQLKMIFQDQMVFGKLGTRTAYFPSFDSENIPEVLPYSKREKFFSMVVSNKHVHSSDPNELHTLRYTLIDSMKGPHFDLYGKGWPSGEAKEIPPGEKIKVISEYKFNLCLENYKMPGYITEKLIECFVAGCFPFYVGAPDVKDYIPMECFYDIKAGREYVSSDEGKKYSYQGVAKQILDILLNG